MICPYNRKTQTTILQWVQTTDENNDQTDLQQIETVSFAMMDCPKEGCGAWQGGRCRYAAVSLENE